MATIKGEFRALGVLSAALGLLPLCENAGWIGSIHRLWPLLLTIVASALLLLSRAMRPREAVWIGVGTYLLGISMLFLVLNYTSWSALGRAWPVFIALAGLACWTAATSSRRLRLVLVASGTLFLFMAGVFYMVFAVSAGFWPVSLVMFGVWVLLVNRVRLPRRSPGEDPR
jgi:hypothetical protein